MDRPVRHHTVEVNERELRAILAAMDVARDQTINPSWYWWSTTKYVVRLYERLRSHGL